MFFDSTYFRRLHCREFGIVFEFFDSFIPLAHRESSIDSFGQQLQVIPPVDSVIVCGVFFGPCRARPLRQNMLIDTDDGAVDSDRSDITIVKIRYFRQFHTQPKVMQWLQKPFRCLELRMFYKFKFVKVESKWMNCCMCSWLFVLSGKRQWGGTTACF